MMFGPTLKMFETVDLNGYRLFRNREEVGFVKDEDLQGYRWRCSEGFPNIQMPTIYLHYSQYKVERKELDERSC